MLLLWGNYLRGTKYRDLYAMVLIASKHDVRPEQLVDALVEALENKESRCGSLSVFCRAVNRGSASFLIVREEKVIWQASVNRETIADPDARDYVSRVPMPEKRADRVCGSLKIGELRFGMRGVDVRAEVVEKPPARLVDTRWGSQTLVSNVRISDGTGSIKLSLWNNQIEAVRIGDEVEIKNCSVARFAGEPQLRIARRGTITVVNQPERGLVPISNLTMEH